MTIPVFIGFDQREAVAYHVCAQSIIEKASEPISIHPLALNMLKGFDGQKDGTNAFIFSRYLVPHLMGYQGWAIFIDGDMVVDADIARLWDERNDQYAALVVKHDYKTRHSRKYIGTPIENSNVDYPRKNWSSVMLINCAHPSNSVLTPEFVASKDGAYLHRFQWLTDDELGGLPSQWNHLVREDPPGPAFLYHYTLGIPGIRHYANDYGSWKWHAALLRATECAGETNLIPRAIASGAV